MPEGTGTTTALCHARSLDADGIVEDAWVVFDGDTISTTGTGSPPEADLVLDVDGRWLTPGFVDLHVHGGGGHAFGDDADAIRVALQTHRAHGTTRTLISLVSAPIEVLTGQLATIANLVEEDHSVLGAHLEGPFLARARCGAHDPGALRRPTADDVARLLAAARGALRQVTLAPELPGAMAAIGQLVDAGVTVAVGHTDADHALARQAFDAGARLVTHAFNAMRGISAREPGPAGAALADERVFLELILDGRHVHPDLASLLFAAAPGRVALVTDAMAAAGSGDGDYRLGGQDVEVRDGLAVLAGTHTLAGSTLTQDAALRAAIELGLDPVAAITALTATPARALGLAGFGRLAPGHAADAVVLDADWSVHAVWSAGRRISRPPPAPL